MKYLIISLLLLLLTPPLQAQWTVAAPHDELYEYKAKTALRNEDNYYVLRVFLLFCALPAGVIIFFRKLSKRSFSNFKRTGLTNYPEMRMSILAWLGEFVLGPMLIVAAVHVIEPSDSFAVLAWGLYLYFLITLLHRQWCMKRVFQRLKNDGDYHSAVVFLRESQLFWFCMALVYPVPFLGYFIYHLTRKRHYRHHPRTCRNCQANMTRLGEEADDAYLSRAQQTEEDIRSVDYDVWKCTACPATEVWNFPSSFTRYNKCSFCNARTSYLVSNIILVSATYTAEGKGEKTNGCKHCKQQKTTTYSIPRLTRSRNSWGSVSLFGDGG